MSTFLVAETGVNHSGDPTLAKRLVEVTTESEADAVKFHSFSADKLTAKVAQKAEYQKRVIDDGDQYDTHEALEDLSLGRPGTGIQSKNLRCIFDQLTSREIVAGQASDCAELQ